LKIIHLSDLHIGRSNYLENATRLVDWILNNPEKHQSKLVIISGDLVDDGLKRQFLRTKEQLDRLRDEDYVVLAAPGNHDSGYQGVVESRRSRSYFRDLISGVEDYPYLYSEDGQSFVLLDSMAGEMDKIELLGAQGCLGVEQLQNLDRILDELADNPVIENVILVLHHHPFDYLFYHGMRDHEDLKSVVSRRLNSPPRVNVLLFGHKHLDHRFNDPGNNKEELFGIDLIYASGRTVDSEEEGYMIIPVIDLENKTIERFMVK
jgi:3',5'-cyclic AMP phosphodiesterase CpdA